MFGSVDSSDNERFVMQHLVLGSSGQIGAYVVDEIKSHNHCVIEWDIAKDQNHDLRYPSAELFDAMKSSDFVHYLASDVGGSKYLERYQDSFDFIANNMQMMETVFNMLRQTKKPFYFASSQMSMMHNSTYGRLKAVGESYTNAIGGLFVHFWNVYGYESDPEKSHVITDFVKMALTNGLIKVRTDGQERRQFMYAEDAAAICFDIAVDYNSYFLKYYREPIPVTTGVWTKVEDIARYVGERLNVPVEFSSKRTDTLQGVENRPKECVPYKTELREGIDRVIERVRSDLSVEIPVHV